MRTVGDFDLQALQAAVDAECHLRGLGWAAAAREVGVSASTLRGLGSRRAVEGDGVLQVLLWLDRTPESFVRGGEPVDEISAPLPRQTGGVLRFDARALHAALEARRAARGMTWDQVTTEIGGTNVSSLTRLRAGGRVGFPHVMRICAWLGEPAAHFVHVVER